MYSKERNSTKQQIFSGGALLAKYSYKKLSQNEAEFIPDDCSEYKTPIIKAARVRSLAGAGAGAGAEGNTDDCDKSDQRDQERTRLLDEEPGDTGTESGTENILPVILS